VRGADEHGISPEIIELNFEPLYRYVPMGGFCFVLYLPSAKLAPFTFDQLALIGCNPYTEWE